MVLNKLGPFVVIAGLVKWAHNEINNGADLEYF